MTFAASFSPPLPIPGSAVWLTSSGATGNLVEWFLDTAPSASRLQRGRLAGYAQAFTPDVPGAYALTAHDLTRNATPPRFLGDTAGAPTIVDNGTAALVVYVPEVMRRTVGTAPDLADVVLVVQDATVKAAMLANARTDAASVAVTDNLVLSQLFACVDVAVASLDRTLSAKSANLVAKYEAHRVYTAGGVHGSADGANAVLRPRAPTTLDAALAQLADLRDKAAAHFLENDSIHVNADTTNVFRAPTPTDATSGHAFADQCWTVLTAHMAQVGTGASQVHGAADAAHALDAQLPLAALNSAFIAATVGAPTTTPIGDQSGAVSLIATHGFSRR